MILLYTVLMLLLGAIAFLVNLRARALERKYMRLAGAVDEMVRQPELKQGNSSKFDPCASAKRAYQLGQLVQLRDRVETKHVSWQRWSGRMARWQATLSAWKGQKLPYTMGALDVWLLLSMIDHLGVAQYLSARHVLDTLASLLSR